MDLGDNEQSPRNKAASNLILPWNSVKKQIVQTLHNRFFNNEGAIEDPSQNLNIAIPNGFQLLRTISSRAALKSAVYIPVGTHERFFTLDTSFAHLWTNGTHQSKFGVGMSNSFSSSKSPLAGLEKWIYINPWKLLIISTCYMELKV